LTMAGHALHGTPEEHGAAKGPQTAELSANGALRELPANRQVLTGKWLPW
jgi:hypothetical protein